MLPSLPDRMRASIAGPRSATFLAHVRIVSRSSLDRLVGGLGLPFDLGLGLDFRFGFVFLLVNLPAGCELLRSGERVLRTRLVRPGVTGPPEAAPNTKPRGSS